MAFVLKKAPIYLTSSECARQFLDDLLEVRSAFLNFPNQKFTFLEKRSLRFLIRESLAFAFNLTDTHRRHVLPI